MAARLAARPGVAAVLFYGARLREGPGDGPLDFYLLTDSNVAYHGAGLSALANFMLPPNVYHEVIEEPARIEAKVAVISLDAFAARMRPGAMDTTLWARFTQPAALVWARAPADREAVIDAVAAAVETAARWAGRLAPENSDADETWRTLFDHTYGSELRVEGRGRARDLIAAAPERYRQIHRLQIVGNPPGDRAATARATPRLTATTTNETPKAPIHEASGRAPGRSVQACAARFHGKPVRRRPRSASTATHSAGSAASDAASPRRQSGAPRRAKSAS